MSLDRAALLAALKTKTQSAEIPNIGTIQVTELSLTEMDDLRLLAKDQGASSDFRLYVVTRAVKDDAGLPIFTDADIPELRDGSNAGVQAIITAVLTVNGLIKDEAKNLPETPSAVSVSA